MPAAVNSASVVLVVATTLLPLCRVVVAPVAVVAAAIYRSASLVVAVAVVAAAAASAVPAAAATVASCAGLGHWAAPESRHRLLRSCLWKYPSCADRYLFDRTGSLYFFSGLGWGGLFGLRFEQRGPSQNR